MPRRVAVGQPTAPLAPDQSVTFVPAFTPVKGQTYTVVAQLNEPNGHTESRTAFVDGLLTGRSALRYGRGAGRRRRRVTAAATPAAASTTPAGAATAAVPSNRKLTSGAAAVERDERRDATHDERALGPDARVVVDRPRRELGSQQQQHADDRRPAVDERLCPRGRRRSAAAVTRIAHGTNVGQAQHDRDSEEHEPEPAHADGDRCESSAGRVGVRDRRTRARRARARR